MHALQQHLPVEVDYLALLPRTKCTYESLKDVLTAIVGEEHTEFNLRALEKRIGVGVSTRGTLRGSCATELERDIERIRTEVLSSGPFPPSRLISSTSCLTSASTSSPISARF